MARLEASACEFGRNGRWYTAAEAKSHLLHKLTYLEDKGAVQTRSSSSSSRSRAAA